MQTKDEELIYNVNYENAMFNYALLLLKQKRYEESETICLHQIPNTFVTGQKNTRGVLYEVLGRALHGQGRHEEAFEKLLLSVNTLDSLRNEKHIDLSDVTQTFETRLAEIASLLCRSQSTVESARYRLHKKLMRDDDSTPMAEYLRSFMG